jgi:hypothetical protein
MAKAILPVVAVSFFIGLAATATCGRAQLSDPLPTNCAGLRGMLSTEIDRMRRLQESAKKEQQAPPADLVSAWQRTFGKEGDGIPSLQELKKVRERAAKLNAALQGIGCPTIDIDEALQAYVARP